MVPSQRIPGPKARRRAVAGIDLRQFFELPGVICRSGSQRVVGHGSRLACGTHNHEVARSACAPPTTSGRVARPGSRLSHRRHQDSVTPAGETTPLGATAREPLPATATQAISPRAHPVDGESSRSARCHRQLSVNDSSLASSRTSTAGFGFRCDPRLLHMRSLSGSSVFDLTLISLHRGGIPVTTKAANTSSTPQLRPPPGDRQDEEPYLTHESGPLRLHRPLMDLAAAAGKGSRWSTSRRKPRASLPCRWPSRDVLFVNKSRRRLCLVDRARGSRGRSSQGRVVARETVDASRCSARDRADVSRRKKRS